MRSSVALLCCAFLLASCGGGGSGSMPTVNQSPLTNGGSAPSGGTSSSAVAKAYVVIDLGANVQPLAINTHNAVVGTASFNGVYQAFEYSGGSMHALGMLAGGTSSVANDINDSGTVIGTSSTGSQQTATLFSLNASPQSLGTGNGVASQGVSVNNAGELVGTVLSADDFQTASSCWGQIAIFDGHGGAQQYESSAQAVAVNSSGTILFNQFAGPSCHEGTITSALYPSNAPVPYPANQRVDNMSSSATDLNDLGDVIGWYEDGTNRDTAGFYYHNGTLTELLPSGYSQLIPFGINNAETVVGEFTPDSGPKHAFIWAGSAFTDLNTRLAAGCEQWTLISMHDINSQGYIVGEASLAGQSHGVLLVPQF